MASVESTETVQNNGINHNDQVDSNEIKRERKGGNEEVEKRGEKELRKGRR